MAYAIPEGPASFDIKVSCDIACLLEVNPHLRDEPEEVAEYLGTGADFAVKLLDFDGFQLHASAV